MPKVTTRYVCQSCGYESPRWMGKCPDCDAWNSFVEEVRAPERATGPGRAPPALTATSTRPVSITQVAAQREQRISSGIGELDRVLGGGIVPASIDRHSGSTSPSDASVSGLLTVSSLGWVILGAATRASPYSAKSKRRVVASAITIE